jgi:hypothetical protein
VPERWKIANDRETLSALRGSHLVNSSISGRSPLLIEPRLSRLVGPQIASAIYKFLVFGLKNFLPMKNLLQAVQPKRG